MAEVLAVGIFMHGRPNHQRLIAARLGRSRLHTVTQRWISLGPVAEAGLHEPGTVLATERGGKFELLNRILADADSFDWVLLCDDDITIEPDWLDRYIHLTGRFDFALSQPARTPDSTVDHPIVAQAPGLLARETRFIEIGPLVCIRRDAVPLILPFEDGLGMGWGLDFIWPLRMREAGKRMGIVDAAPVTHKLRPTATAYRGVDAARQMNDLLDAMPNELPERAFMVLEAYPDD